MSSRDSSETLLRTQKAIEPYIKTRQEAAHVRRVLALHFKSHINDKRGNTLTPPLSLASSSVALEPSAAKSHGLQKEYLRALKANLKAQQEYVSQRNRTGKSDGRKTEDLTLDPFLSLVKQKQKFERLRILQNYIEELASKSADIAVFLDEPSVDKAGLPRLSPDIVSSAGHSASSSNSVDLGDLIQQLEKDVLRAKLVLKKERERLEQVQADQKRAQRRSTSQVADSEQVLKALGKTRNELIAWVEDELGKAGDISDDVAAPAPEPQSKKSIEDAVDEVRAKYVQYLQTRKQFLEAVQKPEVAAPNTGSIEEQQEAPSSPDEKDKMLRFMTPYITELLSISREQRSLTQQRGHLSTSLAKHNKDTLLTLDRLAEESHLLAKHPPPVSNGSKASTFAAEMGMAMKENLGVSHKAKDWTFAAGESALDTMEAVDVNVENGKVAIEEARKVLKGLEDMLGFEIMKAPGVAENDIWMDQADPSSPAKPVKKDIWAGIDGNLGALDGLR